MIFRKYPTLFKIMKVGWGFSDQKAELDSYIRWINYGIKLSKREMKQMEFLAEMERDIYKYD